MRNNKVSAQIKFLITIFLFCIMAIFLLVNSNEIFWMILKKKNYDIATYDFVGIRGMPFVSRFFYKKSKNQFLISKFNKSEKVAAEFLSLPLQEGDLAWCIWSNNTLTEDDCELLVQKLDLNNGFEIFQYIYGNNEHKLFVLNAVSKLEEKDYP